MEEKDVQHAMWWAQQTGQFGQSHISEFHELVRMLQARAVSTKAILGGQKLDEGAFGSIETAYYHGSKVAIKYIKASGAAQSGLPQTMHMVKLELTIVQTLRHPNIVDFLGTVVCFPELGQNPADWSIGTMFEFCGGGQLNKILHKDKKQFETPQKFSMMIDLANGLSYLHAQKVIHRDLGSRNLLLSNKRLKICDFGCARKMASESISTSTISGSPPWMAPEQILGKNLTLKADVFSYGTILWEIATGLSPHSDLKDGSMDGFKAAIARGLEPKEVSHTHIPNCSPKTLLDFNRLLALLAQQMENLRPTAEQARRIMCHIGKGVKCSNLNMPIEGDCEALMQELEDRVELGNKMHDFYAKYNPAKLRDLNKVLETFVGNEDKLNEQMRVRYKADLNGEYPDPEPEQESESDEDDYQMGKGGELDMSCSPNASASKENVPLPPNAAGMSHFPQKHSMGSGAPPQSAHAQDQLRHSSLLSP
eukprot:CAMPEP_0179422310 /NCGR_PEP_ID=MMETSP0799-20121207/10350_1 /TAXON_ID=46947 /ORGANISM="Geminigera cryophila, Strain CCMP2564" /LENGTH=479 /DNA_ID=CAMNT_0021196413 /DNA_START=14 /DNA_END=1453 /DNA_ORIENTATION=-